ncbi:MAG: glucose-6-phosphate isomerase [Cenarchaeum symbiont of Oopsacas minuta]|nr:glucose-6-phosphate isomerase [Cenarchaeum symbiont of Oopsacas minuta]
MLNNKFLEKYDMHDMHKIYDNWPRIASDSYTADISPLSFDGLDHVVFVGMGGSGTVSDIFSAILSETPIHTTIVKGYTLPKTIDANTLVVSISASGNTEETISALKASLDYDCNRIALSAGGNLEKFSKKNGIAHYSIPMHLNPRATLPSMLYTTLKLLGSTLSIDESMIKNSLDSLDGTLEKISSKNLDEQNPSVSLAAWMTKDPIIYYPWGLYATAIRFKNSIHENMKMHVSAENIIESCHNQIMALDSSTNIKSILLRGNKDHPKTNERYEIIKQILAEKNIDYKEIIINGDNILTKIICSIYELDYSTIYGAVMAKIDPYPVKSIEYIKEQLM